MKESLQISVLNAFLSQIYAEQKQRQNNKNDDNVVDMLEKYNRNTEYFHFEILLLEKIPKNKTTTIYNILPNFSPQEIYLGCLKGEKIYLQYRDFILHQNKNVDLLKMVTPNLSKHVWYLETDLIKNRLLKVFCKMNLINMKHMLKTCPIPEICFCPATYKVNDPENFVKTINNVRYNKKVFDFIPYIREYSIRNQIINNFSVYYLYNDIKLVDKKCLK